VRRFAPRLCASVFCTTLLLLCVSSSQAQLPPQDRLENRRRTLSSIRREVTADPLAREKLLAQLAVRDDFRKLQVVNNDLMKRVFKPAANQTITPKEIRSRLGEIKKLAQRLRESFSLPKIEAEEEATAVGLKPGLLKLDETIVNFVDNPSFRELRVYDTEQVSQAAKDLSKVARLADALRRLAKDGGVLN
jgi:hypothetical protein